MRTAAAICGIIAIAAHDTPAGSLCSNAAGEQGRFFHMLWHDGGSGCMVLGTDGAYRVRWNLGPDGNLVAGKGWRRGAVDRRIHYRATAFDPGANAYLGLYGWSRRPLVEYYVGESWGGFTPPGRNAVLLGTLASDGGTYRLYRTMRVEKPSIEGTATFPQYWSVRTTRRTTGSANTITFARHVAAWRTAGLTLGTLDYQVIATEAYGSAGTADVRVW